MKVMIAMSGGVDSSITAYLLKTAGHDCYGVMMKLFHDCAPLSFDHMADAQNVATHLDIPFSVLNLSHQFKCCVIDLFISQYQNGMTPNPCVDCNKLIKFGELFRYAVQQGMQFATGHYAQIEHDKTANRYLLKKAVDITKDQSYFLYNLTQQQLALSHFPLGSLNKSNVRQLAAENGFFNAQKKDSQDICFVPNGDYSAFIEQNTNFSFPIGEFIDKNGKILGRHDGIIKYTIGQRKGLGLSFPQPMYVCAKNVQDNTVTLCELDGLMSRSLVAHQFNFIACDLNRPRRIKAKIRYKQQEEWAMAEKISDDLVHIEFERPQRAIAPGQSVVLYEDDILLGGGKILKSGGDVIG